MRFRLALAGCAVAWLTACGADSLAGSLVELLPLDFDRVELQVDADALRVSYLRSTEGVADITFELVVLTEGLDLANTQDINLASRLEAGQPRASASRIEGDDPVLFPPISSGLLSLQHVSGNQDKVTGSFGLHFVSDASSRTVGAGRTVRGTFSGVLQPVP